MNNKKWAIIVDEKRKITYVEEYAEENFMKTVGWYRDKRTAIAKAKKHAGNRAFFKYVKNPNEVE